MNPNAKDFVFNPSASAWAPPASFAPPVPAPVQSSPAPPPAIIENTSVPPAEDEDEVDENDPLFQAVMKLTLGDREKALKMLEDPDSLLQYPEVRAIMEAGDEGEEAGPGQGENWEALADRKVEAEEQPKQEDEVAESAPASPVPLKAEADGADAEEGEAAASEDVSSLGEGDPRQHLNLVFIGHVDAGKSTLAGSILYIMGKVDSRTIERYEKEAKERNRESWYLAFLMDTSEEERAKGITVEVGRARFETETNRYTILDAPGHKNY
eukprot:gene44388-54281_t